MKRTEHEIRLIAPSRWQSKLDALIRNTLARVIVCVLGRKAGKTTTVQRLIKLAFERNGLRIGWYAHVQAGSDLAFEVLKNAIPKSSIVYKNETDGVVKLVNGSSFKFGTMKDPDEQRGPNYDLVVLDEGAQMSTYARDDVVSAMVADSSIGIILVLTTPKGRRGRGAWVSRDFQLAKDGKPGYYYIHGKTEENPNPIVQEWAAWARQNLPAKTIEQELDAEFLDGGAGVLDFRRVAVNGGDAEHPVPLPFSEPVQPTEQCVVGLDPARLQDWFACAAVGVTSRRLRGLLRFQRMEWEAQIGKAADFWRKYSGGRRARLDTTGMGGDSIGAMLRSAGVVFESVDFGRKAEAADQRFNVDNKTAIVQGLQVETEQRKWSAPWIEELISEGDTFEADVLSSGRIRYSAAEGFHDDLVIAVGLAVTGLPRGDAPALQMGFIGGGESGDSDTWYEDNRGHEIMEQEF